MSAVGSSSSSSSSALSLEPEMQLVSVANKPVTLVAGKKGNASGSLQELPEGCLMHILSFLPPSDVARSEPLNRFYGGIIRSPDQHVWKEQCRNRGIYVEGNCSEKLKFIFNVKVLSIIEGYLVEDATKSYKQLAANFVWGSVVLENWAGECIIRDKFKDERCYRWGNDDIEPFVTARFGFGSTKAGIRGLSMPGFLPLRLFVNLDGSYKDNNDTIRIIHGQKRFILTCTPSSNLSFRARLVQNIDEDTSCYPVRLSWASVQRARASAPISGEWVSSD